MKKIAVAFASLLLVACASSPKTEASKGAKPNSTTSSAANTADIHGAADAGIVPSTENTQANDLKSAASAQNSVYFDFDSFVIPSAYRDVLMQQVESIKNDKNQVVELEGNADERGSSEYNLGLGDKRARAVQKSLELMGVPESQIQVTSLGKEQPRLTCHEEKCWHENRRVDFVVRKG